jgi:hypothetical protein
VAYTGKLTATDPDGTTALTYHIASATSGAEIAVNPATGAFTATPAPNFNGHFHAVYIVSDGQATSAVVPIDIDFAAVNDPPVLHAIAAQDDSADSYPTIVPYEYDDVDGDVNSSSATSSDTSIADVEVDRTTHAMLIRPHNAGATTIAMTVGDATYHSTVSFPLTVMERTTTRTLSPGKVSASVATAAATAPAPASPRLVITNITPGPIHFWLDVNSALEPGGPDDVIANAALRPDAFPGEPLAYKLAREVAERMGRGHTLTAGTWVHEPMTALNSIGFGYCDDVASAFAQLAQHAGYAARVWALGGHVVPEVNVNGSWVMLDPDLGAYYSDAAGVDVGVAELEANPDLITEPTSLRYLIQKADTDPDSPELGDIYGTTDDNLVWSYYTDPLQPTDFSFNLPPGASVELRRVDTPDRVDFMGAHIPTTSLISVRLPAGFTGALPSALVLAGISGDAQLQIGNSTFATGSSQLATLLSSFETPRNNVSILSSTTDLQLDFYINPAATDFSAGSRVFLRGTLIGGLSTELLL